MNRLRDLREDHDLKQQDVADILQISRPYYQCYESGKHEIPLRHCIILAKYYNVSIDYIAGIIPTPKKLSENKTLESKYEKIQERIKKATPEVQQVIEKILDIGEKNK